MDRKKQINELYNKRLYSFFRTEFEGKIFESAFLKCLEKLLSNLFGCSWSLC